uniref:ACYPI008688 protein n=1 Tax=Acyrthosiphon pisum TaxID=7029 RepID=C4WTA2_ACYPI|nr:ACYPI008688 [Acyrthosiphon pisum]
MSGSSGSRADKSELTKHAAGHILQRASPFVVHQMYDSNRQLLNNVNSKGCKKIEQLVKNTFPTCDIKQIRQVHAPQMYGMYLLSKEEFRAQGVQEKLLYHVTSESSALESLESGLDWRRTERAKFGCGVSFSSDADYANYYANSHLGEDSRVLMICCVLVGVTYVPKEMFARSLIVPPDRADTTVSICHKVYVKYNDYEFYPLYFVYYRLRREHLFSSKYFSRNNRRTQLQISYLPVEDQKEKEESAQDAGLSIDGLDNESL